MATDLLHSLKIAGAVRSLARGAPEGDMFIRVFHDAVAATGGRSGALIGGLAMGLRSEPRGPQDLHTLPLPAEQLALYGQLKRDAASA